MNRLTHIRAEGAGIKGCAFEQPLTGCDVFAGPNGSGKSSRLLLVLATARGLATTPTDEARDYLGPERPNGVGVLAFADGAEIRRDLSATRGKEAERATIEAERLMGAHVVRWDLADFARATDKDRAILLERVCATTGAAASWTPERVSADLRKAGVGAGLVDAALKLWPAKKPVGDWLAAATAWMEGTSKADGAFKLANAEQKAADAALKEAARVLDEIQLPGGTLEQKRAELERIRADGEAIRESIANLKAAGSSGELVEINATLTQVQAAETALTTAQATLSTAQSKRAQGAPDAALVRARADASAARQALDALPAESALAQAVTDAGAALDAATTAHASAQARYEAGDSRLRQHAQVLAAIDGEIVALRALAHDAAGTCRHCQGEDPLGLSGRLDEAQARRDAAASEVETWTSIASTRKAAVTSAAATVGSARTQQQAAERALSDARRRRDAAESAVRTADATVTREEGLLRTADALLDAAEASAKSAVTTAEERLAAARATLADLEGRLTSATGAPVTGDLDTLHAQRDALVVDYKRVQAEIELFVRQQERTNAHQAAIARREQALVDFDSVKALKAALNALKSAVAASAYAPIEEAANAFLVDAGIGLRVKFRDEGDFGANVASLGGSYVSFWSLSDAERAEFGAALAVAFAKLTRSPWPAVILDGIEKIDRKHRSGLLRAAGALVHRGELANFLAAYVSDEPPAEMADGVTVHWLGASDAVAVAS